MAQPQKKRRVAMNWWDVLYGTILKIVNPYLEMIADK